MSLEKAKAALEAAGYADRIRILPTSTATVALAAAALGCDEDMIAKTLSFYEGERVIIIVMSGKSRVDNRKFRDTFHFKAHMIPYEEAEAYTGHAPGGVCPFGLKAGCEVYLDESLKKHDTVYPAAGSSDSAVELKVEELGVILPEAVWVDVTKE